ncbi:MAG: hypothetical protein AAF560_26325 [Acidobacteriota bacterium]
MLRSVVGLFLIGMLGAFGAASLGECERYNNSRIIYIGADTYCGGTGPGCTECWADGGSCHTNGESCVPHLDMKR